MNSSLPLMGIGNCGGKYVGKYKLCDTHYPSWGSETRKRWKNQPPVYLQSSLPLMGIGNPTTIEIKGSSNPFSLPLMGIGNLPDRRAGGRH